MDGTVRYITERPTTGLNNLDPSEEYIISNIFNRRAVRPADIEAKESEDLRVSTNTRFKQRDPKPLRNEVGEPEYMGPDTKTGRGAWGLVAASLIPMIAPLIKEGISLAKGAIDDRKSGRGVHSPSFRGQGVIDEFLKENLSRYDNMDASLVALKPGQFYRKLAKVLVREFNELLGELLPKTDESTVADLANKLTRKLLGKHVLSYAMQRDKSGKFSRKGKSYGLGAYGGMLVEAALHKHMGHIPDDLRRMIKRAAYDADNKIMGGSKFWARAKSGFDKVRGVAGKIWDVIGPTVKRVAPMMVEPILNSLQKRAGIEDSQLTDSLKGVTKDIVGDLSKDIDIGTSAKRHAKKVLPAVYDKLTSNIKGEDDLLKMGKDVMMDVAEDISKEAPKEEKKGEGRSRGSRKKAYGKGYTIQLL